MNNRARRERTWVEEIEIKTYELIDKVQELIKSGNVRKLIIRNENNEIIIQIPLTAGVAIGSVVAIISPLLAVLGAATALLTKVKLQVVRSEEITEEEE